MKNLLSASTQALWLVLELSKPKGVRGSLSTLVEILSVFPHQFPELSFLLLVSVELEPCFLINSPVPKILFSRGCLCLLINERASPEPRVSISI